MREHIIRYALALVLVAYALTAMAPTSLPAAILLISVACAAVLVGHTHRREPPSTR